MSDPRMTKTAEMTSTIAAAADSVFPLHYRTGVEGADGEEIAGEVGAFWS